MTTATSPAPGSATPATLPTPKFTETPSPTYDKRSDYSIDAKSKTLTFVYGVEYIPNSSNKMRLTGGSALENSGIVIDANPQSGLLPAVVSVKITFQVAGTATILDPLMVSPISFASSGKTFTIQKTAVNDIATAVGASINNFYASSFGPDNPLPTSLVAAFDVTPSIPAGLAPPVIVAVSTTVSGQVQIAIKAPGVAPPAKPTEIKNQDPAAMAKPDPPQKVGPVPKADQPDVPPAISPSVPGTGPFPKQQEETPKVVKPPK